MWITTTEHNRITGLQWWSVQQHRFQDNTYALRTSVFNSYSSYKTIGVSLHQDITTYLLREYKAFCIVLETKARNQLHIPKEWIWEWVSPKTGLVSM